MTQTSTAPARNTFAAADVQVTTANGSAIIDFTDDNPSRVATVVLGSYGAASLLQQLAEQAGYTLVRTETVQEMGALVRRTIADADARNMAFADDNASPTVKLHAHTDAMRDLRDALRREGLISG